MEFSAPEWCFRSESAGPDRFFEDPRRTGSGGGEMVSAIKKAGHAGSGGMEFRPNNGAILDELCKARDLFQSLESAAPHEAYGSEP